MNKWLTMGLTNTSQHQHQPESESESKQAIAAKQQSPRVPYSVNWISDLQLVAKSFKGGKEPFSPACMTALLGRTNRYWTQRLAAIRDKAPGTLVYAGYRSLLSGGHRHYYTLCDDWEIRLQIILDDKKAAHRVRQSIAKKRI